MKKLCVAVILLFAFAVPAAAADLQAPEPPDRVEDLLDSQRDSFSEGLQYVLSVALKELAPDLGECVRICAAILGTVVILSLLRCYEGKSKEIVELSGVVTISCLLLDTTHSMITLGTHTVAELSEYGKMLIPVMTTALAAQGGTGSATALCTATVFFDVALTGVVSVVLVPAIYIYLTIAMVNAAVGDSLMKKMGDFLKWLSTWGLKLILYAFTGYVSITGVVTGTADQTALKAAKVALGGVVPVVGGILSDASETILVGAAVVKNAIGVYGLLVLLAIVIGPFLKIGVQYLLMKLTAAVCAVFTDKSIIGLLEAFSSAMGLLLAMTGTVCLLLMISVMCFLRGMG